MFDFEIFKSSRLVSDLFILLPGHEILGEILRLTFLLKAAVITPQTLRTRMYKHARRPTFAQFFHDNGCISLSSQTTNRINMWGQTWQCLSSSAARRNTADWKGSCFISRPRYPCQLQLERESLYIPSFFYYFFLKQMGQTLGPEIAGRPCCSDIATCQRH